MTIVQIVSGTRVNGGVRHCLDLTCELARRGHRVILAHKPGAWIATNPLPDGVELFETTLKRRPAEIRRVAHEFRQRRIEVIHSHNSSSHFFSVLLSQFYHFPKVATCHIPLFQPHWWWNDRVIAPTSSTARFQRWLNGVPARRIDVVPNFINADRIRPSRSREEVRRELGVNPDAFLILCVGEVSPRKNQMLLVRALAELGQRGRNTVVALAGGGDESYRRKLEVFVSSSRLTDRVKLLGPRRDVPDLLAASDCFCLPSNREVMPTIACLEAMAAGIPVMLTAIGGVREVLQDGVNALICPRGDLSSLTEALDRLIANPELRQSLSQAAREKIDRDYSPDACIPRIIECYRKARLQKLGTGAVEAP